MLVGNPHFQPNLAILISLPHELILTKVGQSFAPIRVSVAIHPVFAHLLDFLKGAEVETTARNYAYDNRTQYFKVSILTTFIWAFRISPTA